MFGVSRFVALLLLLCGMTVAHGQSVTYQDLHDFGAGKDGVDPGSVTIDSAGNMYGLAGYGGSHTAGTIWEITAAGTYRDLYDFDGGQGGGNPLSSPILDAAGNLYGIAESHGAHGFGLIWEFTANGTFKDLFDFTAGSPTAVTSDAAGNLYGATGVQGANNGTVWELTASGAFRTLYKFAGGLDGLYPYCVALDAAGNLYGSAAGGANNDGMLWKLTPSRTFTDLYDFSGDAYGFAPYAVMLDSAGNLYGTTVDGGAQGYGRLWELTTSGTFKDLYDFGSTNLDGKSPNAGLAIDANGDIYGTTTDGGLTYYGIVWEFTASGTFEVLYGDTKNGDGYVDGIALDEAGNLFGPAAEGANIKGMEWELSPAEQAVSLALNPNPVGGGSSSTGTVTISAPSPIGGTVVQLSSGSTYVTVPSSVTVPVGQTTATFTIATKYYPEDYNAKITAKAGSTSQTALLAVDVPVFTSLTLNPSAVAGGTSSTGTVSLDGTTPSGGTVVYLTSSSADATVPASVTIQAGQSSASFTISTIPYSESVTSRITAKLGAVTKQAVLSIDILALSGLTLNPTTVAGGNSSSATVTLNAAAPSGGAVVYLSSSSADATVPPSVTVPAGQTSYTFSIPTVPYSGLVDATITAHAGSVAEKVVLTITAPALSGLSLNPATVIGGTSSTGTVTLSGTALPGGTVVSLSSSSADATVPPSVTIPAGQSSATFTISTIPYSGTVDATIKAKAGSVAETAVLTIQEPAIASVSLSPNSVKGGASTTGTVTLTGPAPAGGTVVSLGSTSSSVHVPATVTVPAGQTTATFTATTSSVTASTPVEIAATAGGFTRYGPLTVTS